MSEGSVTVYEKRTCTTCRRLVQLLEEMGVPFERVDYVVEPIPRATLARLLELAGLAPADVVRAKDARAEGIDPTVLDDAGLLDLLAERPHLLQRPIVVRGDRVVLARPPEKVRELF